MCNSNRLCENEECKTCFEKSFASHEKSKYLSEKTGHVKPRQVFKFSHTKYWFDCDCGHQFESALSNIAKNKWCPYCANPPKQLCENADCKPCFEKSFASHEKSKYWSEKNDHVIPRQIFKGSSNKYWFDCGNCGHEFNSYLSHITSLQSGWCSYCANQKLCENEDCKTCFEKSFASHEKSKYWSDKNIITPRQVSKRTHEKYWFNCICGHDFKKKIEHITENNSWCPYCCNTTQKLCHNNECKKCYENSFASHEKSKYWSDKNLDENGNIINPRQVVKGSGNKYYFMCDYNHDFNSSLDQISGKKTWCPICVNKTEKKIYEQLLKIYPSIVSQFRSDWCKNIISKRNLPFDFVIEEQKIIIELDGAQHFVQVMNWKTPEENLKNDQYKEKCANENGYSVIRIIQEDVWNDAYDWLNELTQNIIKITSEHAIQNIYMCKNNEYNTFNSRTHSINLNV